MGLLGCRFSEPNTQVLASSCESFFEPLLKFFFQGDFGGTQTMLDLIFIVATVIFFAVGILYVRGCERLR